MKWFVVRATSDTSCNNGQNSSMSWRGDCAFEAGSRKCDMRGATYLACQQLKMLELRKKPGCWSAELVQGHVHCI